MLIVLWASAGADLVGRWSAGGGGVSGRISCMVEYVGWVRCIWAEGTGLMGQADRDGRWIDSDY